MIRIRLAFVLCLLLFGGCATASKQAAFPRHYTLTAQPPSSPRAPPASTKRQSLRVARIVAPAWLQGTQMYYRLDYRHDHSIAAYADSDWVSPPARMLEQAVQTALAAGGGWRVVVGPGSQARTELSLQIRLDDFSQAFTSPGQSRGVLDATATLVENRDEQVIAQRHFHIEAAAPTADAAGGVAALNDASRQFAAHLQRWLPGVEATAGNPHPDAEPR